MVDDRCHDARWINDVEDKLLFDLVICYGFCQRCLANMFDSFSPSDG